MSSSKPTKTDVSKATEAPEPKKEKKVLEEDDEFEDFPAEDWTEADTEVPGGKPHLWEESWDDDDTTDDFAAQLREEIKKIQSGK